jgi:hypothetical protein
MGRWGWRQERAASDDYVIDLVAAEAELAAAAEVVEPAKPVWGSPSACPVCRGHGRLDRIDIVDRVMFERCLECGHRWSVAEKDTVPAS